ncbi:hypothetical protein PVK06_043993 [Gossypium arboreum]|uniref:Fatty acid hydroxylase domain-containing protein n=1 Tax=Gossypium arboreum TaxID=29729 RepID=A0ABR0MQ27_GOSAR|nr:hypothetical protein PVK06_043993 [Gossypium arboreum]
MGQAGPGSGAIYWDRAWSGPKNGPKILSKPDADKNTKTRARPDPALVELYWSNAVDRFKLQPRVKKSFRELFKCYKDVLYHFIFMVVPLITVSFPVLDWVGIRTGFPLPTKWEVINQLIVYYLVEDNTNYWIHRFLHGEWGYEKIHYMHHECNTPIGFAAPYAHWAEILILGIPTFLGPAMVPCHMTTLWLWSYLRQVEAIEIHSE